MKKHINKLASIILALAMFISFAPTANALTGTQFEHAKFDPVLHFIIADVPEVKAAYDKVQALMVKYDAVTDQLNALNLEVYRVFGPIVSSNPCTVQYRLPTSEYVRVGDDYIKVTTYYHAIIDNPQNGTESGGYYTGYHARTGSENLNNTNYIYYGSAGKTFNDLYATRLNYLNQYNAAVAEYNVIADAAYANNTATAVANEEAARKIFANYVEFSPNRVMIDCAESDGMDYSATVFQIGNPYYATGRGYIASISIINGNTDMSAVPVIKDGTTMVPVRPLINSLTCEMTEWNSEYLPGSAYVEFDSATQTVNISIEESKLIPNCVSNTTIKLTINSNIAYVNDVEYVMDKPAQVISGKTMIPLRAVSEMLNCKVEWVPDGQFVVVSPKSVQEFRNPLWNSAKYETTIDGIAYHRVDEDPDFYGASYLLPDTFVSSKIDVYGYRVIEVGQIEIFLSAIFDIQEYGVSEQEYASTYDLNPFYLEDGTKGEHLYVAGDKSIYYLTIEDGGVEAVTGIYFLQTGFLGAWASEEDGARYRDEVSNNAKLMRPELLQFVKSFHRDAPVG